MPTTQYIYLGNQYLCEADETGTLTKRCVNEPGTYTNLVSRKDLTTGETSYPLYDALGSTRSVTDENGDVTDTFVYDAWGNVLDRTGTTEMPFQYVGRHGYYHDAETDLSYVMARIYDPRIIRWLSVDPLYRILSYLYAFNRHVSTQDPSGLYPLPPDNPRLGTPTLYAIPKRCIFTMTENGNRNAAWDQDAREYLDYINKFEAHGCAVYGVTSIDTIIDTINSSKCCEIILIGHRGGLSNPGIVTTTSDGETIRVFPNDTLSDSIGKAMRNNRDCVTYGCNIISLSCQLSDERDPLTCADLGITDIERSFQDDFEQANWQNVANRTGCYVTTPRHLTNDLSHTCNPRGRQSSWGPLKYPRTRFFRPNGKGYHFDPAEWYPRRDPWSVVPRMLPGQSILMPLR